MRSKPVRQTIGVARLLCAGVLAVGVALALGARAQGQGPANEHAKHHPDQAKPSAGGMMEQGHGVAAKELYPSLMELPELTPERREQIRQQADERMRTGTAMLSEALERLSQAAEREDYAAMQTATAQMREALGRFESGVAARRALAEGKAPRDLALQWFKHEMNLPGPSDREGPSGPFGLSWFHFFVMVLLIAFATVMIWMYFHKMRRASELLKRLTSSAPVAGATVGGALAVSQAGATPPPPLAPAPDSRAVAAPVAGVEPTRMAPWPPPQAKPVPWSGLLRVARIFEETQDVNTFRLAPPAGGTVPFSYLPGQFLSLTVRQDGRPVRRSYTIASSPTRSGYVEVTVKRVEQGAVSGYLHDRVKEGDEVEVAAPFGSFTFTGKEADSIVLVGGGVGITPLMSVIRNLTDLGWPGDIFLIYSCRSPRDFVFREELMYLQHRCPNLHVVATMTRAEGTDWKGPTRRLTKELIAQSVPNVGLRRIHLCGPPPLMEAVQQILAELGVPAEQVKTESFTLARGKPEPEREVAETKPVAPVTVTFPRSGKSAPLSTDRTVLEVAESIGVEIPNVCRAGVCGVCKVKLLSGSVTMAVQDALTPEDKVRNLILACQAKSTVPISVEA